VSRIFDPTNSSKMVRSVFILNESRGKLEVVEKKERKLGDFRVGESADEDQIRQRYML
jgi:hypothetical protein